NRHTAKAGDYRTEESTQRREELLAQLPTGSQHDRQVALLKLGQWYPPRVRADVHGRPYVATGIAHGHGEGSQALLQFLVDNAPTLGTNLLQAFPELFGPVQRATGLGLQLGSG